MTLDVRDTLVPLSPLARWYALRGLALPAVTRVDAEQVPQPYRSLLVHAGDMTGRLTAFHGSPIRLRVLGKRLTPRYLSRLVVLERIRNGEAVEFGAIDIHMERFDGAARLELLAGRRPMGEVLHRHGVRCVSEPAAFVRVEPDALIAESLSLATSAPLLGRCNVLYDESHRALAEVVEILPPARANEAGDPLE